MIASLWNDLLMFGQREWSQPTTFLAAGLWALGLYWAFSPLHQQWIDWLGQQLSFDRQAVFSSLLGIIPWLVLAVVIVMVTDLTLGKSWAGSLGLMACISCGLYELGRRDSANRQ